MKISVQDAVFFLQRSSITHIYVPFAIWMNLRITSFLCVDLRSHGVPEEIELDCPPDDLGQLCEYAN